MSNPVLTKSTLSINSVYLSLTNTVIGMCDNFNRYVLFLKSLEKLRTFYKNNPLRSLILIVIEYVQSCSNQEYIIHKFCLFIFD